MKKIFRGIIAVLLVAAGLFVANGVVQAEEDKYTQKYKAQIQKYTDKINKNPNDAVLYYNRGFAYDMLHQRELAIKDYSKAIQLNPDFAGAYYYDRGLCYKALGNMTSASADFAKAKQLGY